MPRPIQTVADFVKALELTKKKRGVEIGFLPLRFTRRSESGCLVHRQWLCHREVNSAIWDVVATVSAVWYRDGVYMDRGHDAGKICGMPPWLTEEILVAAGDDSAGSPKIRDSMLKALDLEEPREVVFDLQSIGKLGEYTRGKPNSPPNPAGVKGGLGLGT